MNSSVNNRFE